MAVLKLTDATVKSLRTEAVQEDFWDSVLPAFGVRVTGRGTKSFFVIYHLWGKKYRRTLGRYPKLRLATARELARRLMEKVEAGEDPGPSHRRAVTFGQLAELYIDRYAKLRKKSWREDQRILRKDLLPHWGGRPADRIQRRDVVELLDRVAKRGPIMANRTRALISRIFSWAVSRDLVETNPAYGSPVPGKGRSRDRVLSAAEIGSIWRAVDQDDTRNSVTVKLRLLTAQRGIEVMSMGWGDIEGNWWMVPAEVSKNGLAHRVFLSEPVREILIDLRGTERYVFPAARGRTPHLSNPHKTLQRIRELSGVSFRGHDLRRTAATHMARLGISRLVIAKILNHAERGVTAVYDRASYDREKRQALKRWGREVQALVSAES